MFFGSRAPVIAAVALLGLGLASGCAIFASRPVQEMSDTAAALRAAREVQADSLAPEFFRQANEWYQKARREYKYKNFKEAKDYSDKARRFAEQAEFEAIRSGGTRAEAVEESTVTPIESTPYSYPTPDGTPADIYDQRAQPRGESNGSSGPGLPVPTPSPF